MGGRYRKSIFIRVPCSFPSQQSSSDSWNPIEIWSDFALFSSTDECAHHEYHVRTAYPMGSYFHQGKCYGFLHETRRDADPCTGGLHLLRHERNQVQSTRFGCESMAWGHSQVQFRLLQLVLYSVLSTFFRFQYTKCYIDVYMVLV